MNDHNLIPFDKRTKSEQREIASCGGKKSGEVRRKKRDMKKTMEMLLQLSPGTDQDYQNLSDAGVNLNTIPDDELNNLLVVNAALLNKAKSGDVSAIKELRNIIHDDDNYTKHKIRMENAKLKLEKQKFDTHENDTTEDDGLLEALTAKGQEVFTDDDYAFFKKAAKSYDVVEGCKNIKEI